MYYLRRAPEGICPQGIIKSSSLFFSFSLAFSFLFLPIFTLLCSSGCLYLSVCLSIFLLVFFLLCSIPFSIRSIRYFVSANLSLSFSNCFFWLSAFSSFPLFSSLSLSLFRLSIYFPVDKYKKWGKLVMSSVYSGFHRSAVKLHSRLPFPASEWTSKRERAYDTRHGEPQAVLFCHIVGGYLSPMRFDDRSPSDARASRAVPVPSGIRQFCLYLSSPFAFAHSVAHFIALVAVAIGCSNRVT